MEGQQDIRARLSGIPEVVALLEGIFAEAPVGFQLYTADGQCLLTNQAFRALFGSEPPPGYNVLEDEILRERGMLELMHRAFQGETVHIPPVWYDPRDLRQVRVEHGRRIAVGATAFPLFDEDKRVRLVGLIYEDVTTELLALERAEAERTRARQSERRARLLSDVSTALSGTVEPEEILAKVASLLVPELADVCTLEMVDERAQLRRLSTPPSGNSSARDALVVPIVGPTRNLGTLRLERRDGPGFSEADRQLAKECAGRIATAAHAAALFRAEQGARSEAESTEQRLRDQLEFTSTITASLAEGLYAIDREERVTFVNPAAEQMLGWTARELTGKNLHEWLRCGRSDGTPLPDEECPVGTVLRTGVPLRSEDYVLTRKDGSTLSSLCSCAPIWRDGQITGVVLAFSDISARKKAERELARLTRQQELVLEAVGEGIVGLDLEGRTTFVNPAAARMFGYRPQELIGASLHQMLHACVASAPPREHCPVESAFSDGRVHRGESEVCLKRGALPLPVEYVSAPIREHGRVVGAVVTFRDLTDRRRADRRLQFLARAGAVLTESLDYQTTLAKVAHLVLPLLGDFCAIDLLEEPGRLHRVAAAHFDPKLEQLLRVAPRFAPPLDREDLFIVRTLKTGKLQVAQAIDEAWLARHVATGPEHLKVLTPLHIRAAVAVPLVARGNTLGVISLMRCAEGRGYDDEELRLAEELARRAAQAIDNARLFREADATSARVRFLAEASKALSRSLELDETLHTAAQLAVPHMADACEVRLLSEDFEGQRAIALREPETEPDARALFDRLSRTAQAPQVGRGSTLEELSGADPELKRLLRELGVYSLLVVPLMLRGRRTGTVTWATSAASGRRYDSKDLRFAEELAYRCAFALENARLYEEATQAIRARDDFLSVASHELKTPLTPLQLQISTLERSSGQLTKDDASRRWLEEHLAMVRRQSERLTRLVNQLLDISRIVGRRVRLQLEPVNLREVVDHVVTSFDQQVQRSGSPLEVRIPPDLVGRWDRGALEQILENLLSNALKYGARQPIVVEAGASDSAATLTVIDRGIGIPPEAQERIFGRFERAVSTRHYGGLGLGLYVVRQLVEALGGTVRVDSRQGEGARFTVTLPFAGPMAGEPRAGAPEPSATLH